MIERYCNMPFRLLVAATAVLNHLTAMTVIHRMTSRAVSGQLDLGTVFVTCRAMQIRVYLDKCEAGVVVIKLIVRPGSR